MENQQALSLEKNEIIKQPTPSDLIAMAIDKNLDVEKLKSLFELQEKFLLRVAREDFFNALCEFQVACPVINKTKKVLFEHRDGSGKTEYWFAPLDEIIKQIKEPIKNFGLTYRWEISDVETDLVVSCIITHKNGHSEKTTMRASADTSGKKNAIQQRGSTIQYLKRYTLLGALGITTADSDVDGIGGKQSDKETELTDKLFETGIYKIKNARTVDEVISLENKAKEWGKFSEDQLREIHTAANSRVDKLQQKK